MANGTVSLHSWNDGAEDDEGDPPVGTNYNSRLDIRNDFNRPRENIRNRATGRGLRSTIVRPQRLGQDDEDEGGGW